MLSSCWEEGDPAVWVRVPLAVGGPLKPWPPLMRPGPVGLRGSGRGPRHRLGLPLEAGTRLGPGVGGLWA